VEAIEAVGFVQANSFGFSRAGCVVKFSGRQEGAAGLALCDQQQTPPPAPALHSGETEIEIRPAVR
jgi:hypothetical protein